MSRSFARRLALSILLAVTAAVFSPVVLAQPAQLPPTLRGRGAAQEPTVPAGLDQRRADEVREELRRTLEQYPPTLGRIFRLDPALMTNAGYMAPYPVLAAFFLAHPEVPRHPDYFLSFLGENGWSEPRTIDDEMRQQGMNMQRQLMESLTIAAVVATFATGLFWLVRLFVSHRRWIRATRLQSELNNRLLERMGSNEQLLAYIQSQAGQQLMAMPVVIEPATPATAAPYSRILWAIQAGIVLMSAGAGFLVIRRYVFAEAGEALLTIGVLAITVGVGFALASMASYLLSRRFGLLEPARDRTGESGRV
jgi:uncharacterized membrane protein